MAVHLPPQLRPPPFLTAAMAFDTRSHFFLGSRNLATDIDVAWCIIPTVSATRLRPVPEASAAFCRASCSYLSSRSASAHAAEAAACTSCRSFRLRTARWIVPAARCLPCSPSIATWKSWCVDRNVVTARRSCSTLARRASLSLRSSPASSPCFCRAASSAATATRSPSSADAARPSARISASSSRRCPTASVIWSRCRHRASRACMSRAYCTRSASHASLSASMAALPARSSAVACSCLSRSCSRVIITASSSSFFAPRTESISLLWSRSASNGERTVSSRGGGLSISSFTTARVFTRIARAPKCSEFIVSSTNDSLL
mmetsp:Transcript_34852/g.110058  ORF Transcript_34852/g.110058 Transcript_34852/m.110058 type:complete len:319 (-) Transcript_34852:2240-3196(-)